MNRETVFLQNNSRRLERIRQSRIGAIIFRIFPKIREAYKRYTDASSTEERSVYCADVLDELEKTWPWRLRRRAITIKENIRVYAQQTGRGRTYQNNLEKDNHDYYSVAVIVKNEARYIREFILFYQATGADRIYLYDNDSTDNLREVLEPFLKSGFVKYRFIHGPKVQTVAYREAVRRTKGKTKWLAIVDADEFLFSPKGRMPEQLKAYEEYPGVGVNWVMFGPNGHDKRPEGLIMDNYTTALADHDAGINCHIKSIVQPAEVDYVAHTHYAIYKGNRNAVNECREEISNKYSFVEGCGRAFTHHNQREIFRINHYCTKSLEDLKVKCDRGYADGAPNAIYEKQLAPFKEALEEDHSIKAYADIVRAEYDDYR